MLYFREPKFTELNTIADDMPTLDGMLIKGLPVWSFFIGFFPSRGLALIENISTKALGLMRIREFVTPLTDLPGMNYDHEIRLNREGYDNIETSPTPMHSTSHCAPVSVISSCRNG